MTPESPADCLADTTPVPDPESAEWVGALSACGAGQDQAVARLHAALLRVARAELARRGGQLRISGPELDDLAHQATADAVVAIIAKITQFRGESRFTTWAYRFVILEVSAKIGRHFWRQPTCQWTPATETSCQTGSAWTPPGKRNGATWLSRCGGRSSSCGPASSLADTRLAAWAAR